MIDKYGIEKYYMIHSGTGSTFQPIYRTKREATRHKRLMFPNDRKAWVEEMIVCNADTLPRANRGK